MEEAQTVGTRNDYGLHLPRAGSGSSDDGLAGCRSLLPKCASTDTTLDWDPRVSFDERSREPATFRGGNALVGRRRRYKAATLSIVWQQALQGDWMDDVLHGEEMGICTYTERQ